ncbi:MAG: hypothetical protein U0872_07040 [Planctomycetaceae bacterium]
MACVIFANGTRFRPQRCVATAAFSGSSTSCANHLLAEVHGVPAAEIEPLLIERIAREIAHNPAFNESINTVNGQPHGHILYSWNSVIAAAKRNPPLPWPDLVPIRSTVIDAKPGCHPRERALRLEPEQATRQFGICHLLDVLFCNSRAAKRKVRPPSLGMTMSELQTDSGRRRR